MVHQKDGYRSEIHDPNPKRLERSRRRRARNRRFAEKAAFHGINWDSYNHYQLYDMIMSADPGAMGEHARKWKTLGDAIKDTTDTVQDTVTRLLTTWRGPAAVRAAASNTDLAQWADLASYNATSIGAGLTDYTEAVERAQHAMPPPEFASAEQNFRDGYDVKGSGGPSTAILIRQLIDDQKPDADKDHAAKAEAVRVMKTYSDDSQRVHDTMPWFYDGPEVTTETPPGQPPPQPPGPIGDDDPPGGRPPIGTPIVGGVPGPDDGTTAAGFGEPAYGPGGSGPGGPGSGANGPGYGVGGLGGPGSGSGADATRGGPGAAGAGPLAARGPGGTAGGPGGLGGVRGAGGIGGAGGLYPPMAGGARGNGEDDAEHKNKYDDGLDLFDDLPPAYPPVFGA